LPQNRTIVLASASPRRKELLEKIGLKFIIDSGNYPENLYPSVDPALQAKAISLGKARLAARKYPDALIIAADTLGVLRGKILGKPRSADEAVTMLQSMSGKSHRVITAFTVLDSATGKVVTRAVETRVYFHKLSSSDILSYVQTGEPLDKAGAYAIQGHGSLIVRKIEGDYFNVVGLPLSALAETLREFGVKVL
jgi:septum formation protein